MKFTYRINGILGCEHPMPGHTRLEEKTYVQCEFEAKDASEAMNVVQAAFKRIFVEEATLRSRERAEDA